MIFQLLYNRNGFANPVCMYICMQAHVCVCVCVCVRACVCNCVCMYKKINELTPVL